MPMCVFENVPSRLAISLRCRALPHSPGERPNKPQMCSRICPPLHHHVSPLHLQILQKHTRGKKKRGLRGQGRGEGGYVREETGDFCSFIFSFTPSHVSCHHSQLWGGLQMFIMCKGEEKRNHKLFYDGSKVTSADP